MPLSTGTRLGPYEIRAPLGAGGMGEVYRALDTKLDREVAIKLLLDAVAGDSDRLARFEREAKVLAQLNHPGIASIYGVEDRALVMELVPGPTLADRIAQGPIPPAEAEEILLQIADAVEYAHERGIVHRDLKPANIKIDPDDKVKILDFGLAKAFTDPAASAAGDPTNSPTVTMGATVAGTILGTAAYMAPEQARGKKVDKRADIWAFGVVIYEMLTGERLFQGDDVVQVLSRVLEQKPPLERVPAKFRQLLERCLDRNPKDRLRDIGEARFLLTGATARSDRLELSAPTARRQFLLPWAVAGLSLIALAGVSSLHFREQLPEPVRPVRFQFVPEKVTIGSSSRFALSPDGSKLAYFASSADGTAHLWIREFATLESRPLPVTDFGLTVPIFWSFDSRYVVYQSGATLKKVDVSGGPPQTLCEVTGTVVGGSWNRDGVILFGKNNGPLQRVSAEGGTATAATALDKARSEVYHAAPVFLPDGRHFLYLRMGNTDGRGLYLGSLDDKPGPRPPKPLIATGFFAEFMPAPGGRLGEILFLRETTLLAQRFDLGRLEVTGDAVPVAEKISSYFSGGQFSSAQNGALVYRNGGAGDVATLTWFDRGGKTLNIPGDIGSGALAPVLSPDGTRAAVDRLVDASDRYRNLWLLDLGRGSGTRFTFTQNGRDEYPAWSPDGTRLAFTSNRTGTQDLYEHATNGAGEDQVLFKSENNKFVNDWSRDGRFLLFENAPARHRELWVLPMEGAGERKPVLFLRSEFDNRSGRFSPDGHWIAYASNESGTSEIYVRPFPAPTGGGRKWMVSQGGGTEPRWRRDGKELFYLKPDGEVMVSAVSATGAAFQPGVPKPLFRATGTGTWDVAADGTKFLIPIINGDATQYPFTVVLNWMGALKQ